MRTPDEDRDLIPVARPRPATRPPARGAGRAASASDAGAALIGITVLISTLGWLAGRGVGVPVAGAMVGGLLGVIAAFTALYFRYRNL